jgi:hypothetical protein
MRRLVVRNLRSIALAVLCVSAAAQQNSRSGAVRLQTEGSTVANSETTAHKAVALSGRVSDDGKFLVSEDQDRWSVSNPSVLAKHTGRLVTVKCQLASDQNSIHVLAVKPAETKYVAIHGDSAFRR